MHRVDEELGSTTVRTASVGHGEGSIEIYRESKVSESECKSGKDW